MSFWTRQIWISGSANTIIAAKGQNYRVINHNRVALKYEHILFWILPEEYN